MNYSTITQKDEPILNREVKLSLKTILGAAAFASFAFVACVLSLSLANFSLGREFCRATVGYGCLRG